jgi:hypothetical protein
MNMNTNYKRVPAEFGPETGFAVRLATSAPFRARQEAELERLKARLLAERLAGRTEPRFDSQMRRAASEAAALAWTTHYPLLVFPALFEESRPVRLYFAPSSRNTFANAAVSCWRHEQGNK